MRRLVIALVVLALLVLGGYVFARSRLASDLVRAGLEEQLARRLGQPVTIQAASARIFPAVAVELHDVTIGEPPAVVAADIRVVTGLRGLLSRTITDAEIVITQATLTMPLPFGLAGSDPAAGPQPTPSPAFTVASIDRIALRDVSLEAGGTSVAIDLDSSVQGDRLDVSRLTARATASRLEARGALSSIASLQGTFEARADPLDLDEIIAIGSALTATAPDAASGGAAADPTPVHLVVKLTAPAGRYAAYTFSDLSATVDLVPGQVTLAPLLVRALGGTFQGRLDSRLAGGTPAMQLAGRLDGFDVPALLKASGSPGGITGTVGADVSLGARRTDPEAIVGNARGWIDAAITDGSIPGLDLVRTIVLAFGRPSGAPPQGSGSAFSRLGGRFTLADGVLATENLAMASRDFDLTGRGSLRIATGQVSAHADVILSTELTAQAGTDLRRYAQDDGRVIVPVTIGGTLQHPTVAPDIAAATRRALGNELRRRATSLLDELFKRRKK